MMSVNIDVDMFSVYGVDMVPGLGLPVLCDSALLFIHFIQARLTSSGLLFQVCQLHVCIVHSYDTSDCVIALGSLFLVLYSSS